MKRACFLAGFGPCAAKLSAEHYVSRAVLRAIGGATVQVAGLPWQPRAALQSIGIDSLASKVLCANHNSGLSQLDSDAGSLFRVLNAADKRPSDLRAATVFDGNRIERWFLKIICGLAAGLGVNQGMVPAQWKSALTGGGWPEGWGLYVPPPPGAQILAREFSVETLLRTDTYTIAAAKFRVAGVHFTLPLGRPDRPAAWGAYHPNRIVIRGPSYERHIEFNWLSPTGEEVVYSKIGVSADIPIKSGGDCADGGH
jgi:hypothetical protein